MIGYKDFPKGDARRIFVALIAVADLGADATLVRIAQPLGISRSEAERALTAAVTEFDVHIEKAGSVYRIVSWGVLKEREVRQWVAKPPVTE